MDNVVARPKSKTGTTGFVRYRQATLIGVSERVGFAARNVVDLKSCPKYHRQRIGIVGLNAICHIPANIFGFEFPACGAGFSGHGKIEDGRIGNVFLIEQLLENVGGAFAFRIR